MKFIKNNQLFVILQILLLIVFSGLIFYNFMLEESSQKLKEEVEQNVRTINVFESELENLKYLDVDFPNALQDNYKLAKLSLKIKNLSNSLVNLKENHKTKLGNKTPSQVNADMIRLFTYLRKKCNSAFVSLPTLGEEFSRNAFASPTESKLFGFGFSCYDGFWPSFSTAEVSRISLQISIARELIENLCTAAAKESPIEIISLKREAAGSTDTQFIKDDLLEQIDYKDFLLQQDGLIKSEAFELKFKCDTATARRFLNQLRPPFLLRNLSVDRMIDSYEEVDSQTTLSPFNTLDISQEKAVSYDSVAGETVSEFTLLLEYLLEIKMDFSKIIENSSSLEDTELQLLNDFLKQSGNKDLLSLNSNTE